jgi:aminodeoxyfutalosine deaminase
MTDSGQRRLTLKARYLFPVAGRPIRDGMLTMDGERIATVGGRCGDGDIRDLGNVAILPGLVNAHVHLDFSDLAKPLGGPGINFVDWIRRVMEFRGSATSATERKTVAPFDPVTLGLQESIRYGVTTLGDIAQPDDRRLESPPAIATETLNLTTFQELIAPTSQRVAAALKLARAHVRRIAAGPSSRQPGLSPHAPYTVHPELLAAVIGLSTAEQVPVAMHLAESREELELLQHGSGPLRVLLEELGAWDATAHQSGLRPLDYLRLLASAHRALVIHGNYLDDEEIAFLAANARHMAAIYCPRTHHWFARDTYPLETMLAAGAVVALGTDGRGSSPDLSLLAEMRFVARHHPTVVRERILRMGTIDGARALGWETQVGSLEPGKRADLTIVALPDCDAADPHELLFDSAEPVVGCYCRGVDVWRSPDLPNRRANSSSTSLNGTPP